MDNKVTRERISSKDESCHETLSKLNGANEMSCPSFEYESPGENEEKLKNIHETLLNLMQHNGLDFSHDIAGESSEYIRSSVNKFKEKYEVFMIVYLEWKKSRVETIKKLLILQGNIHNDQLKFNKANAVFKNLSVSSRQLKINCKSIPSSILSSVTTLFTDVVCSVTSVAQALNIDVYIKEFAEIMDKDMKITKHLYSARSIYFEQYKDVEEVVRKYHSETFSNTISNIANVLKTEKLWTDIKSKIEKDQASRIFDNVKEFINTNLSSGGVVKAYSTFRDYADKNPAILDACNSAGKIVCDVYDTFGIQSSNLINISEVSIGEMLLDSEITELNELRTVTENSDNSQAKLESDIQNAIIDLQREMKEIDDSFFKEVCMDLI